MPLQSISDSCRHLTELQWSKKDSGPPEIADEINYKCGDAATPQELQGTYFPNQQAAELLSLLLEPLVVSVLCIHKVWERHARDALPSPWTLS